MAEMTASSAAGHGHHADDAERALSISNQKLAMWLYLASEIVIFSILIGGYVIYRVNSPDAVALVQNTLGVTLVTINTFILLASSYAMVMGLRAMELGNKNGFFFWIGLTAVMGFMFLGGQYIEYNELQHLGITLKHNEFSIETELFEESIEIESHEGVYTVSFHDESSLASLNLDEVSVEGEDVTLGSKFEGTEAELTEAEFEALSTHFADTLAAATASFGGRFYAPTAFHGFHVLIGVLWALVVMVKGWRGSYDENSIGIELFGLYWHFVDVVWILLFTLIYLV